VAKDESLIHFEVAVGAGERYGFGSGAKRLSADTSKAQELIGTG